MNISIYLPVLLVQIFLWGCVTCSFLGLIALFTAFGKKVLINRKGYWLLILHLTMRQEKSKDWTWQMFTRLIEELHQENPKLVEELREIIEYKVGPK